MDEGSFFEGELLPEFAPTPTAAWHEALAADLGPDWDERLRWEAAEGITLRPFYRAEDLGEAPTATPGTRPGWQVCHPLPESPEAARQAAPDALDGGAEALVLPPPLTTDAAALRTTLADIDLSAAALHLSGPPESIRWLRADAKRRGVAPADLHGTLAFDPAAHRFRAEAFGAEQGYEDLAALVRAVAPAPTAPSFRLITADARPFAWAGAGPVEALALALGALSEHTARLSAHGLSAEAVLAQARVVLPVGPVFFVEVARLRALRSLFAQLAAAYGAPGAARRLRVQAVTAWRSTTLYDPHLNLLRGATAAAAAAVVGGADALAVRPFDAAQRSPGAFARRLALDAQHVLREEAHLGRVADPVAGSYYAEVLTDRIARCAWQRFQEIESAGGLLASLRRGAVHERLSDARDAQGAALARRERVRVGTNHYPNLDEERLDEAPPDLETSERETAAFERLRLATERYARATDANRPAVFLLATGTPKVRAARARFARNALGCVGFRILGTPGFDTVDEGVRAAADAVRTGAAQLVVCCAPDEDYAALLPATGQAFANIERDVPVLAAADPGTLSEEARTAADAFVHRGMNLLATLAALQERLGVVPS